MLCLTAYPYIHVATNKQLITNLLTNISMIKVVVTSTQNEIFNKIINNQIQADLSYIYIKL